MKNKNIYLLNFSHFLLDSYGSLLIPILPILTKKFSLSIFSISIIMAISYFMSSIMQPVFGSISDRMKSPWLITVGLLFACIFPCFVGVVPSALLLAICIIFTNLGEGLYHPQATAFVNTLSSKDKLNTNLGVYLGLGTLGFATGPVVAGFIANNLGLENLVFMLIPAIVGAAIWTFCFRATNNVLQPAAKAPFLPSLLNILKIPTLRYLIILGVVRPLILVSFCIYMPFLWQEIGYDSFQIGVFIGLFSLIGSASSYIGGVLTKKIKYTYIFSAGFILTTISGIACLYFQSNKSIVGLICFFLVSFFVNLTSSVNISLAQERLPEQKAMLAGIINGFNWGIIGLSLGFIGFMIDKFGIVNILGLILIIPSIATLLLIPLKTKRDSWKPL